MQPTRYPIDFHRLYASWRKFVDAGWLDPDLDPLVAMSWRRCVPKNNPYTAGDLPGLSDQALQSHRIKLFNLIALARPFMEDIYQLVEGSGYIVVLLDASACVLEVLGDATVQAQAEALGLRPGAYWDEGHAGTNAFGLALWERSPQQVVGAEHFFLRFHALTTSAAPIYTAEGHPIGVLGMVGLVRNTDVHPLAIVHAAARAIENQLQADKLFTELNAQRTQLTATLEAISDGLIVCDDAGLITHMNTQAAQILNLKFEAAVGRPLSESVGLPDVIVEAYARHESLTETEVTFQVKGLQIGCLISLIPVNRHGETSTGVGGCIMTLRRIEQVHRLVQRMVGARSTFTLADFVGESSVINQVRRQAQANVPGGALTRPTTALVIQTNISFAVNAAGEISPAEQVSVRPEINGRIEQLPVDIGDRVKKGDLLFKLDDKELQQQRASNLTAVERTRLELEKAERDHRRAAQLLAEKLISQELYDDTKTAYELAKNALDRAQKELAIVEERLTKTEVRAPFDCTVLTRPVSVGQAVSGSGGVSGGTEVLTIADLNSMVINAHVNQADVPRLKVNQVVEVTVEAVPGLSVTGVVERIAPQATIKNNIKGFAARILLRNVDPRIRPGMTANIKIPVASADNVAAVPLAAVFTERDPETGQFERFVYVQHDGTAEKRNVKVGVSDFFYAEIQSGLSAGEVVLLELPKEEREKKARQLAAQQKAAAGAAAQGARAGGEMTGRGGSGRGEGAPKGGPPPTPGAGKQSRPGGPTGRGEGGGRGR